MARRIVDLTRPLDQLGSNGAFSVREYERPRSGHGVFHRVDMETTAGTHVVTSRRYLASGYSLSETPLDKFFGEGVVVRFPTADGVTEIGISQLEDAAGDRVQRGDIVVLAPVIDTPARLKLTVFGTQWLWNKGIKMLVLDHRIGIGTPPSWSEERTVLTSLFANEIPVVREATNTEGLSDERFAVMALPIQIEGVEAWPVRVVALDPGEPPTTEPPADPAKAPAAVAPAEADASVTKPAEGEAAAEAPEPGDGGEATDADEQPASAEAEGGEADESAGCEPVEDAGGEPKAAASARESTADEMPAEAPADPSDSEDAADVEADAPTTTEDVTVAEGDEAAGEVSEAPAADGATDSESESSRQSES